MEGALQKSLSENIQEETKKHSLKKEGAEISKSILSSTDILQVETDNFLIDAKGGISGGLNGQTDIDSESVGVCEPANESESLQEKTYSPTLMDFAFKVMKNLFSPEKTKSKSANIISPLKQHQSASGSPNNSTYITRKPEIASSESGIENALTLHMEENSMKNQLSINQAGVLYSPLTVESHNNTDESFLTTVSIIDDSFHSAITNLDENGEALKLEENVIDNFLNNTENLEVGDPYNETLENSEYCLENTTLRNGSFGLEGTKLADISVLSKDGTGENWSSSQVNGLYQGKALDDSKKIPEGETQSEASKNDDELPKKSHCGDDFVQVLGPQESSNASAKEECSAKLSSPVKNMNMEHLFLNKSFDKPDNNSDSLEIIPGPGIVCENSFQMAEGEKKKVGMDCFKKLRSESCFEVLNCEREDVSLENAISTTTVVLNSAKSFDLDPVIMSLDDVSDPNSPQVSVTGSASILRAGVTKKQFLSKDVKHISNTSPNMEAKSLPEHKSPKNKLSVNERDSPANKIKLHRSDELIHRRILSESPEGKRTLANKKSSLDVSLIKSTDVSKQSSPEPNPEYKSDRGILELNVKKGGDSKSPSLKSDDPITVSVFSQQSYTVLNNDKNLNRPVIDNITVLGHFPGKQTFQTDDLSPTCSAETMILETSAMGNYCNASLGAAHPVSPIQQKQSTPLAKGSGRSSPSDNSRTPGKPLPLNLTSPNKSAQKGKREAEYSSVLSKPDSTGKTIQIFNSNEDPAEFSPVNPVSENELLFSNSVECGAVAENSCFNVSDPKSTGAVPSKEPSEPRSSGKKSRGKSMRLQETVSEPMEAFCNPNQTFSKKLGSPQTHKLNQTFDKKQRATPGGERLNVTYDKNGGPPSPNVANKTFTKKIESLETEISYQTLFVSESPDFNEMNKTYDKNSGLEGLNQTFDIKTDPLGPQKSNETFDQKSPTAGHSREKTDTRTGSPISKITDQTFVKEKDIDAKETLQDTSHAEETASAANVEPELPGVEEEKAADEVSPEDIPVAQSMDQQDALFIDGCPRDLNGSFISGRSSGTSVLGSELSTLLLNEGSLSRNQSLDDLAGKLKKLDLNESSGSKQNGSDSSGGPNSVDGAFEDEKNGFPESGFPADDKLPCDPYLVQLIQEQFSSNDIEKICSVVDCMSSMKLSSHILRASKQFDRSFRENTPEVEFESPETEAKPDKLEKPLSPKSFDFLNSIQGKPTGRDLSRESLYVKFDPLVQPNPNSLIDFTKEGQTLAAAEKSPPTPRDSSVCERLLSISPQKKTDDIVPPLTPLSHKSKTTRGEDNMVRIKELQNEIYFLKNLYAERERTNKAKMEDCESQVAKLTGENCFLEDRLKEANEREKSLVKKMKEQNQSLSQLKIIMEEYVKVIAKLTAELETLKAENQKQVEALTYEKDSYVTHLQNTEAAFTDVHAKYEKSKKTIVSLKTNEAMYRNTIAEQAHKMEDFKKRAREAQEKAVKEFEKIQEELGETKASHNQETARLRAQLRKTELKVEALQESLEQKIKENQQLTAICDELIEGKK